MSTATETVLEIDLRALAHNYGYLRSKIDPTTKFLAVVKAFAYGSDSVRVAKKLEELGTDYFAVAYTREGEVLRNANITTPILVLHPLPIGFDTLITKNMEPSIYSFHMLDAFLEVAKKNRLQQFPIHIKFNTGLNRLGFNISDIPRIVQRLVGRKEVKIVSLFSHLAATEDKNEREFTLQQIASFKSAATELGKSLGHDPILHILNTSGIINYPQAQMDMVRSGIGLYGYGNEASVDKELRPVATLKTLISQLHHLKKGDTVGYNRAYRTERPMVTATLPLGHADGIGRPYGNGNGAVWVNGRKAPIIGNVCMDMIMVDVTGIPCKEGDEVIVFGPNTSADILATTAHTISYELLTGISQRVRRSFIDG
ncbi:MAG: alanine racemase [Sediminicola sp.]